MASGNYADADHGQPDNATEAYYNYCDDCDEAGEAPLSLKDWSDREHARRMRQFQHPIHGFSQEDIWHEMRAIGGDERQAIRSLIEAEARLDD